MNEITEPVKWRKATYSNGSGACVEVAVGPVTGIRDTKNRAAGHLAVEPGAWSAFLAAVTRK